MNVKPHRNLERVLVLMPRTLVVQLNEIVERSKVPTNRSAVIRELVVEALEARRGNARATRRLRARAAG